MMYGIQISRPSYVTLPRRLLFGTAWTSYLKALESHMGPVPDVIHAHVAYPDGRAAVELGARIGRPVVVTVHGHDLKDLAAGKPAWRGWVRQALTRADAVIAVSGELAGLARELGVTDAQLAQIPNGVDCTQFQPSTDRVPGEGGWRLIYVGRYDPAKGLGELLQAMAGVRAAGHDVKLDLVGGGSSALTQDYPDQARALGLTEHVRFVDEVSHDQLPSLLAEADLFVLPSHSEGLPLSLLEALATGLPVVTTRCGGPEEVMDDSLGRLAEPRDVAGLQQALTEVLDGYHDFDRRHIRQVAETRYDYRAIAQSIWQVYERVHGSANS